VRAVQSYRQTERQEFSNAANVCRNSPTVCIRCLRRPPFRTDTFTQSITPLIQCSVDNVLIKATPLFNQSFFQMIDVTDLATVGRSKSCWKRRFVKSLWKWERKYLKQNDRFLQNFALVTKSLPLIGWCTELWNAVMQAQVGPMERSWLI